ncbi:MAG: peptidoglycan-associated lipoprotein Pal [Deltaproteobacteria bacterium]|nr:peptidoglycan-associated lipoprotein Pal [Deltaproteobacteria bacterium]
MKTFKLLSLMALSILLTTGCASLTADTAGDACETIVTAPTPVVPTYEDEAVIVPVVAPIAVPVVATPILQNVHFAFDQHTLSSQARTILDENTRYLQVNSSATVTISGHCDERGSDEYNLALGERRAFAARDYLTSMGISSQRINTISYGEEKPLDMAGSEEAWAKNRRAEFTPQF